MRVLLVVTVPAYNEARFLRKAVRTLLRHVEAIEENFVVLIAEDGSMDGSDKIAQELAARDPRIIHVHSDRKLGRGLALKKAWKEVDADIYVYVDCDLATDMSYFPQLVNAVRDGYDFATGSRYIAGAKVRRPPLRYFTSKTYNRIIRVVFKTNMRDHQIGFKAFSRRLVKELLDSCESDDWFWDTEIIARSRQKGYRCLEFPVKWEERRGRRTPIERLINDVYIHGKGLIRLSRSLGRDQRPSVC